MYGLLPAPNLEADGEKNEARTHSDGGQERKTQQVMKSPTATSAEVEFGHSGALIAALGVGNKNLKDIAEQLQLDLGVRGHVVHLSGEPDKVAFAQRFLVQVDDLARDGIKVGPHDHLRALHALRANDDLHLREIYSETVLLTARGKPIKARGLAQMHYVHAMRNHDLTFGIGPAGTGKTYLAMAMAVRALTAKKVRRIILTRPAVEAGERLGFLPGDLAEKVNPYLRPLYDALDEMMDADRVDQMLKRGQIEVAPLAFMRGRTLNDCFVILDEAQNATSQQMRMFLTRLGHASHTAVTGDVTQVDLPTGARSGLAEAQRLLSHIEGISFCQFTEVDVVRHPLVQRIVVAYEKRDAQLARAEAEREAAQREAPADEVTETPDVANNADGDSH